MKRYSLLLLFLVCLLNIGWLWKENPRITDYLQKGYKAWQEGNLNEALNFYDNVLMLHPDHVDAINFEGVIYEELGVPQKAEEKYLTAIKIQSDYLPAYSNLAILYWNQGQKKKAVYYLTKRVKMGNSRDPWTVQARNTLKTIENNQQKEQIRDTIIDQAVSDAKPLLKPQTPTRVSVIDEVLNELDHPKAFKKSAEVLPVSSKEEQVKLIVEKANNLASHGAYLDAVQVYDKALHLAPGDPQIIKSRVDAYMKFKRKSNNWK